MFKAERKEKDKLRRQWKLHTHSPHQLRKRSHFGTKYRKAPPPQKGKEKSMGIKRVAGLAWNRLLMRVDNSTGKGTSGMDKFSNEVHRVHMEPGGKLLNSLRINQEPVPWKASSECKCYRWCHPHPSIRMMWRVTEDPWRMLQRSLCCSFAAFSWFWSLVSSQYLILTRWMSCRVWLRSLGRCCLGLVALLVAGGAAGVLPFSLNCPLPFWRTYPPTLVADKFGKNLAITKDLIKPMCDQGLR
jgi:hypothetical protein